MLTAEARAEFLADLVPEEELQVSCDWWRPGHVTRCSPLIGPRGGAAAGRPRRLGLGAAGRRGQRQDAETGGRGQ